MEGACEGLGGNREMGLWRALRALLKLGAMKEAPILVIGQLSPAGMKTRVDLRW